MAQANLEQQNLDLLGPAYALEWMESQRYCSRRQFRSAEELRTDIKQQAKEPQRFESRRRLLVLRELPVDYVQVLRDLLDVDAGFIDAHVSRLSYRPLVRRRRDHGATQTRFVRFEYPELFTASKGFTTDVKTVPPATGSRTRGEDNVEEPPLHVISEDGEGVLFRRASLWQCAKANVLILNRSTWTRRYYSSDPGQVLSTTGLADGDMSNFESLLYRGLAEEWHDDSYEDADIRSLVQDIVVHEWAEFFDMVSSNISPGMHQMTELYWQVHASLERNLSSAELCERLLQGTGTPSLSPYSSKSDWESLLSRLNRHVSLLNHLAPISTQIPNTSPIIPGSIPSPPLEKQPLTTRGIPPSEMIPRHRHSHSGNNSSADEQNKHALDRVSYMGGILLPLSIVSSILSMSDPFGPTGPMFYVFWAAAVPLVFVAILIIYADSIRKAEVWIEVASNGGISDASEEKPETDLEGQALPYNRLGIAALGRGEDGEEAMGTDSFDEPAMMVEKLFKDAGSRKWQKEQLGWGGACKTALHIYKLKKGKPPSWVRHGRTA
ncbi:putative cysteine protease domain-containing protein [Daldinia childiae]|uniref:putative cysteine protease domain-containing protein n=1 Tax=Daldinia childiae TaxID=326645 RepID=UPI001445210D|nr:putative cysteine protease domain-containing protein [Daldinia childiae]KAF3070750.1 putative cysteine protease domain-containing protein [Daldinia childiae]